MDSEARIVSKGARTALAHFTKRLRFLGVSSLPSHLVLFLGLTAMTAFTVPDLRASIGGWLAACLWCCLSWFAVESAFWASAAFAAGSVRRYLRSPSRWVDLLSVFPVPIALLCGVPPPTASWGELLSQAQAAGFPFWLLWPASLLVSMARAKG